MVDYRLQLYALNDVSTKSLAEAHGNVYVMLQKGRYTKSISSDKLYLQPERIRQLQRDFREALSIYKTLYLATKSKMNLGPSWKISRGIVENLFAAWSKN